MIALIDRMDVYTQNGHGIYATLAQAGVACRLGYVGSEPATSGVERAELAALRNLIWAPEYDMPEACQVQIDGVKWNPQAGTFKARRGPIGSVMQYRQCDVVRAADG